MSHMAQMTLKGKSCFNIQTFTFPYSQGKPAVWPVIVDNVSSNGESY